MTYITDSPEKTKKLGELLAKTILDNGTTGTRARVLLLRGDLGAGKTQFVQGFARGLKITETINSPTFVILKKYPLHGGGAYKFFYHIDCYRLGSGNDLKELGFEAVLADPANIVAVEWPGIVVKDVPFKNAIGIEFEMAGENERRITFKK